MVICGHRARQRVGVEAGAAQHPPAGVLAQMEGGGVEVRGQMADAAMAELEQVLEGGRGAALGVEAHRRAPRGPALDEHDLLVGRQALGRHDLEEQVAVDRAGAQRLERLLLPAAVVAGVDQRHGVAGLLRRALGAAQDAGEERVGHVGDQQRDRPRAPQAQRLRRDVGPVAELARARGGPSPAWPPRRDRGPCPRTRARPWTATRRRGCATSTLVTRVLAAEAMADMQPRRRAPWGGKQRPRAASSLCDEVDGAIRHT